MTNSTPGDTRPTNRDDLPLKDYTNLTVGDLGHRIRSLDAAELQALLGYEQAHRRRTPVVQLLQRRLDAVTEGAPLSGGGAAGDSPLTAPPADGGSPVQPATGGPAMNPPSHGVPTNPAQPRSTG